MNKWHILWIVLIAYVIGAMYPAAYSMVRSKVGL